MTDAHSGPERRRSMCPMCPDMRGVPIDVKNEETGQTVMFRCPGCEHVWRVDGMETLSERFRKLLAGELP